MNSTLYVDCVVVGVMGISYGSLLRRVGMVGRCFLLSYYKNMMELN